MCTLPDVLPLKLGHVAHFEVDARGVNVPGVKGQGLNDIGRVPQGGDGGDERTRAGQTRCGGAASVEGGLRAAHVLVVQDCAVVHREPEDVPQDLARGGAGDPPDGCNDQTVARGVWWCGSGRRMAEAAPNLLE